MINLLKKKYISKSLSIMRGYSILKNNNNLDLLFKINRNFTIHEFKKVANDDFFSSYLLGIEKSELALRQYLLSSLSVNKPILKAIGGKSNFSFGIPDEWSKLISDYGISVNFRSSKFLFYFRLILYFFFSIYLLLKAIKISFKNIIFLDRSDYKSYIYFSDLTRGNLPNGDNSRGDIVSWYFRYRKQSQEKVESVKHNVKGEYNNTFSSIKVSCIESPYNLIASYDELWKFTKWAFPTVITVFFKILIGSWWYVILFPELVKAALINFSSKDLMADEYLFHNSGWIYRPLWTYIAENKGAKVSFYFYSTNSENFKSEEGYPPLNYGWEAMSWPNYLVWDSYQKDFIHRAIGYSSNIEVVGAIDFHSSLSNLPLLPEGILISVFDVQPMRDSIYVTLGAKEEYYIPRISNQFILDILQSCQSGMYLLHKRKRKIGKKAHPKYRNLIGKISTKDNYISIDPDISARKLIQSSDIVISMPFTSTALIAREEGKPSIYYDPSGIIHKDDRAAHGIPIISGREELKNWIQSIITQPKGTL